MHDLKSLYESIGTLHAFHVLTTSIYPAVTGATCLTLLLSLVFKLHNYSVSLGALVVHLSMLALFATVMLWFVGILQEAVEGDHTIKVQRGLKSGMLLFIVSEVMFFFAFFWSFFHYSLNPAAAIGAVWPPVGTQQLNIWALPFVNTSLLLTSGITITLAHAALLEPQSLVENRATSVETRGAVFSWELFLTIALGLIFLACQGYEYKYGVKFSWRDNLYGSIFFITTGFHGFHVTLGTFFLLFCWFRNEVAQFIQFFIASPLSEMAKPAVFTQNSHFGFEAAAWYWHFVDVVWLFLFITIYWWGGAV